MWQAFSMVYNGLMSRYVLSFTLIAAVLVVEIIAFHDTVLLKAPGFHVIMHIAGGMGIGLFLMGLVSTYKLPMARARILVILGVLIFGLLWELFEALYNLTGFRLGTTAYYLDTFKDLVNDAIGGGLVMLLMR